MQERNLPKHLTITHPMHYNGSQIFWLCACTRCLSICAPSFLAVVWCKWARRVIALGAWNMPQTVSCNLNFQKFLSYILLFKFGVPSELKCSVGNKTWEVVGSKDTCPHKKGKVIRHNCRGRNMTICSSPLPVNLHGQSFILSLTFNWLHINWN